MELNEEKLKYKFYFLITDVLGKNNSGTLVRSASAFNCDTIFILGQSKKILKKFFGNHGTVKKMKFQFFNSIDELKIYCQENKINICAININYKNKMENIILPIEKTQFLGNTLFIFGNKYHTISSELEKICNQFSYVDQNNSIIGDLDICIVGTITFHHFGLWANYKEARLNDDFKNEKYIVNKTNK